MSQTGVIPDFTKISEVMRLVGYNAIPGGTAAIANAEKIEPCSACSGIGQEYQMSERLEALGYESPDCPECNGTGNEDGVAR